MVSQLWSYLQKATIDYIKKTSMVKKLLYRWRRPNGSNTGPENCKKITLNERHKNNERESVILKVFFTLNAKPFSDFRQHVRLLSNLYSKTEVFSIFLAERNFVWLVPWSFEIHWKSLWRVLDRKADLLAKIWKRRWTQREKYFQNC